MSAFSFNEMPLERFLFCFAASFSFFVTFSSLRAFLRPHGIVALSLSISLFLCAKGGVVVPEVNNAYVSILFGAASGVLLALPFEILLHALVHAGRIIDTLRGAQFAEQMLLDVNGRMSSLEACMALLVPVVFFSCKGVHLLLEVLSENISKLVVHPVDYFLESVSHSLQTSLLLAFPVIIVMLLLDVAQSILSRVVPRANIQSEFLLLKMLCGVLTFGVSVYYLPGAFAGLL